MSANKGNRLIKLGWEEWLSLPDLALPAIKAKIDTGARTSALSATHIETFGPSDAPKVRFTVHPEPGNYALAIPCAAPLKDRRTVTSSNGETELRHVIETTLSVGGQSWPIEVTLTDRDGMAYHMLLGRMAMTDTCVVVPGESHQQPELDYAAYAKRATKSARTRPLRIAVLTKGAIPAALSKAATARGHTLEPINPDSLSMRTGPNPALLQEGRKLPLYDAVIPRLANRHTIATLRQFEVMGTFSPASPDGVAAAHDPLRSQQLLARHGFATRPQQFPAEPGTPPKDALTALVIGKRARLLGEGPALSREDRRCLTRAAQSFGLKFAEISFRRSKATDTGADRLEILGLSARPSLTPSGAAKGKKSPAQNLIALIERHARPKPRKRR